MSNKIDSLGCLLLLYLTFSLYNKDKLNKNCKRHIGQAAVLYIDLRINNTLKYTIKLSFHDHTTIITN